MTNLLLRLALVFCLLWFKLGTFASEPGSSEIPPLIAAPNREAPLEVETEKPAWGKRLLWYIPNRVMDLFDMVRLRVKAGPGLSAHVRVTDFASFYVGGHKTVYAGLPGPRYPASVRSPLGLERQKGLVVMGVDASDDLRHPATYTFR